MKLIKETFNEIYYPSSLSFESNNQLVINSDITKALADYGNYFELINLYTNNQPHLYDDVFKVKATTFLYYVQYQLLRKKQEQEYINASHKFK